MVRFKNYTNEEIVMSNGDVVRPCIGPKTMKPSENVIYIVPDDMYIRVHNRSDVTSPRKMKGKK